LVLKPGDNYTLIENQVTLAKCFIGKLKVPTIVYGSKPEIQQSEVFTIELTVTETSTAIEKTY
jgi:hypothetical protein